MDGSNLLAAHRLQNLPVDSELPAGLQVPLQDKSRTGSAVSAPAITTVVELTFSDGPRDTESAVKIRCGQIRRDSRQFEPPNTQSAEGVWVPEGEFTRARCRHPEARQSPRRASPHCCSSACRFSSSSGEPLGGLSPSE